MASTRRDILQVVGGFGAGLLFTPVPWRLLADTAMWTQNWPWLPKTPRGPMTTRATRCTLCPSGCPIRVQCVGGVPTGIRPAGEPLCAAGFVGHHLAFHPRRLRSVTCEGRQTSLNQLDKTLRAAITALPPQRKVAVLDLAPGRTASLLHRRALSRIPNSVYLEPPVVEGGTAAAVAELLEEPAPMAIDINCTRTLFSVGTPVAEGWASPYMASQARRPFRLIQVDSHRSHTADVADTWLPVESGDELDLLAGIARAILVEGMEAPHARRCEDFGTLCAALRRREAVSSPAREMARAVMAARPAVVVADGDPANGPASHTVRVMAAALNVLIGAVGVEGGYRRRPETPTPSTWDCVAVTSLETAPDGSIGVLILDDPLPGASLPWSLVENKLAPGALVVACTWDSAGVASRAPWLAPARVFLETMQDAPPGVSDVRAIFQTSDALFEPPAESVDAVALLTSAAGQPTTLLDGLRERAKAIHASGRGQLWRAGASEPSPLGEVSVDELWSALQQGGYWRGEAPAGEELRPARLLPAGFDPAGLTESPRQPRAIREYGWRQATVSPLLGKLWRESGLRRQPGAPVPKQG